MLVESSTAKVVIALHIYGPKLGPANFSIFFRKTAETFKQGITINIASNMLRMEELRATLTGAKFISKFDLATAFHQLKVRQEDTWKLAFFMVMGHYEWLVMPIGVKNAPTTFQRLIRHVLAPVSTFSYKIVII